MGLQKTNPDYSWEEILVLETSIDDMNPEFYPYVLEMVMSRGALDAYLQPVIMKKGRPGLLLTVLARPRDQDSLLAAIFAETTTLGIRVRREKRVYLARGSITVTTKYGPIRVKVACTGGHPIPGRFKPEYEDCRARAGQHGVPLPVVYNEALLAAEKYGHNKEGGE